MLSHFHLSLKDIRREGPNPGPLSCVLEKNVIRRFAIPGPRFKQLTSEILSGFQFHRNDGICLVATQKIVVCNVIYGVRDQLFPT